MHVRNHNRGRGPLRGRRAVVDHLAGGGGTRVAPTPARSIPSGSRCADLSKADSTSGAGAASPRPGTPPCPREGTTRHRSRKKTRPRRPGPSRLGGPGIQAVQWTCDRAGARTRTCAVMFPCPLREQLPGLHAKGDVVITLCMSMYVRNRQASRLRRVRSRRAAAHRAVRWKDGRLLTSLKTESGPVTTTACRGRRDRQEYLTHVVTGQSTCGGQSSAELAALVSRSISAGLQASCTIARNSWCSCAGRLEHTAHRAYRWHRAAADTAW
jgi:hypothetical protein